MVFLRQASNDYRLAWEDSAGYAFYRKERLAAVEVRRGGQAIRRYDFSYANPSPLFPGVTCTAGGKTLALSGVQEHNPLAGKSLPQTQFLYDDLHLVEARNGYGGRVVLNYDAQPWYHPQTTPEKSLTRSGCHTHLKYYNGQSVPCAPEGGALYLNGSA